MKGEYRAKDPRSMWLRMIAGGGGSGLTIEQPENNIVRGAYYALISALSGAQTVALCCYDEAFTIPSEFAQRVSLRTMQILIEEMGLTETVDPLAGSFYVETMTNEMEKEIKRIMADVDRRGGIVNLIATGELQAHVSRQAYIHQRQLESGDFRKVGVNCYRVEEEDPKVEMHPFKPEDAEAQVRRLNAVKAARDAQSVKVALKRVEDSARGNANVMPAIVEAVKAYATVGEITQVLEAVFGRYQEVTRL
jgi:methylmalonyl-CoA mutase N-terminal domain/subunit